MFYRNKKGVELFLPMLVIITFFLLGITAYAINKANLNLEKEGKIGETSTFLFKIFDEAQKAQLYIEESTRLASIQTAKKLADNGGTSERNNCQKSKPPTLGIQREYILFNTCKGYDAQESFQDYMNSTVTKYLKNYQSAIAPEKIDWATAFFYDISEEERQEELSRVYSYYVIINSIASFKDKVVEFQPIKYAFRTKDTDRSTYEITPKVKLDIDLSIYEKLHQVLFICTSLEDCQNKIKAKFPDAEVIVFDPVIYIKLTNNPDIYIAIDTSK